MIVIPRNVFRDAIQAGISASEHLITHEHIERLKEIGLTAPEVGDNFISTGGPCCPAAQAGLKCKRVGSASSGWVFAKAYDRALARAGYTHIGTAKVVD
jgi:hypothetical protein